MVFPTLFNLNLNLVIRSSWSEPQSASGLVFADCIMLLHLCLQEYNQSDFGIDHLMMSMCRVLCCWKRVFATTSAFSCQNSTSFCFILYSEVKSACLLQIFLSFFFTVQYCIGFAIHQHASATVVHVFLKENFAPSPDPAHGPGYTCWACVRPGRWGWKSPQPPWGLLVCRYCPQPAVNPGPFIDLVFLWLHCDTRKNGGCWPWT